MFATKTQLLSEDALRALLPPQKSFCVAHSVWKGIHRGFELNPQTAGKRTSEVDSLGIPYVKLNVKGMAQDVAKRILRDGHELDWFVCPHCGVSQVKHPKQIRCSTSRGGCGNKLGGVKVFTRRYRVSDGFVRQGDGCTYYMFDVQEMRAPKGPAQFRLQLGVAGKFVNDVDEQKFQKYYKRFLAPVQVSVKGHVTKVLSNGFEAVMVKADGNGGFVTRDIRVHTPVLDGQEIRLVLADGMRERLAAAGVKYRFVAETEECVFAAEMFYDGGLLFNCVFASWLLNREVVDGEGLQVTVAEPTQLFKGLAECDSRLNWDAVLFMGKKQLVKADGTVTFQVMTELHASSREYTDAQSWVAMDMSPVGPGLAVEAMMEFQSALNDASAVGNDLKRMMDAMSEEDLNDPDEPCWSLIQAYRAGLPVSQIPWCRRRLRGFFRTKMLNMSRFRVPLPEWAVGCYGAVDRSARDADGFIHPELAQLKDEQCVIPSADGACLISVIRRPVETKNSQSILWQVPGQGALALSKKSPYIYLPIWSIPLMVPTHGGFDFDDRFQVVRDLNEVMRREDSLVEKPYPVAPLMDAKEAAGTSTTDAVIEKALSTNPWDAVRRSRVRRVLSVDPLDGLRRMVTKQMGRQPGLGIGRVSNDIIWDNDNFNNGMVEKPALYRVAPNLESVIDSSVHVSKDGEAADGSVLQDITLFENTVAFVDEQLLPRVPKAQRERVTTYQGGLSNSRKEIEVRQSQLEADLDAEGEDMIAAAMPEALESVVATKESLVLLRAMQDYWKECNRVNKARVSKDMALVYADAFKDLTNPDVAAKFEQEVGVKAYKDTQRELFLRFEDEPGLLQAVALGMKEAYCGRRGSDYMFSGNHTVGWFIKVWTALQVGGDPNGAGLTLLGEIKTNQEAALTDKEYAPAKQLGAVTVAEGLRQRGLAVDSDEVKAFKAHAGEAVVLEMSDKGGKQGVEVLLAATREHHSWVMPSHLSFIDGRLTGVLAVHPDPKVLYGMQVVFTTPEPEKAPEPVGFKVVAGLEEKFGNPDHDAVVEFRSLAGRDVELVSCVHLSEIDGSYEDAVLVMDGEANGKGWHAVMTDEDVLAQYEEGAFVGYLVREDVARFNDLDVLTTFATLISAGQYSLKAVICE